MRLEQFLKSQLGQKDENTQDVLFIYFYFLGVLILLDVG